MNSPRVTTPSGQHAEKATRMGAWKEMLLYGSALLMMKGASLITLPFMTHYLSVKQIGQLELLATSTVLFTLLTSLSMHESLYRFIATLEDKHQQREQTNRLYITAICISLLVVTILFGLYKGLQLLAPSLILFHYFTPMQWILIATAVVLESALAISLAWLRLQGRAEVFFKLSVVSVTCQVSLILLVVRFYPSVTAVFCVGVATALLQCLLLHCYHRFHLQLLTPTQIAHYLRYCLPIMGSALIAFGLNGGERWIVAQTLNLELLGQYAIALKFALAVGILLQPFHMWWMPKRFECWQTQGAKKTAQNSQAGIVYACVMSLGVVWLAKWFIILYLPSHYSLAVNLIVMTVAAMLYKELVEIVNIGLLKSQQTRRLLLVNLIITATTLLMLFIIMVVLDYRSIWLIVTMVALAQLSRFIAVFILSQQRAPLPYHSALSVLILITSFFLISAFADIPTTLMFILAFVQPAILLLAAQQLGVINFPYHAVKLAWQRFRV
ncbi:lipopolysaccharide biosynthesis protein [Vibrio scophthalmi]|uniref:lipopolysaccharide biosynthesis protein n=1 Tax=Vibrio scophthalmi TaxID=45658 RepID=UPI003EB90A2F